jgi:hypothetical protein
MSSIRLIDAGSPANPETPRSDELALPLTPQNPQFGDARASILLITTWWGNLQSVS